ncbi:MAG: DUF4136 domain-containing protein [Sphingomonadaceae bacterium]
MSVRKRILALAAPVAALALSACATGLPTQVKRFQAMPAPQGQSFAIVPEAGDEGGLEFNAYAELVRMNLVEQGFRPAAAPGEADFVVTLDYGIDEGEQRVAPSAGYARRFHPYYYPSYAFYGRGLPFYYGWYDPFWYRPIGYRGYGRDRLRTYTVYESFLEMDIARAADGYKLFEGTAKARSREDDLPELMPSLVEAMFTDFPGRSGETVKITVAPRD